MPVTISDPYYGSDDPNEDVVEVDIQAEDLRRYVRDQLQANVDTLISINEITRDQLARRFKQKGRTTIDDDCGYLDTSEITIEALYELYKRDPLARRICNIWAEESWRKFPKLTDTPEEDKESAFRKAFEQMCRDMSDESWADKETATNEFWSVAFSADALSTIGNYSAIVIGLDDKKPLSEPVDGFEDDDEDSRDYIVGPRRFVSNEEKDEKGKIKLRKVNYLQAYSQRHCRVCAWEQRKDHKRFGKPTAYEIRNDDDIGAEEIPRGANTSYKVHWSRVVHICPDGLESKVVSDSQLLVVFNRLWDAVKVYAGSAEGFWQGAIPGLSLEPSGTEPVALSDAEVTAARTALNDYITGVKRFLLSNSLSAKTIAPSVVAPDSHINVLIEIVCIVLGIPVRIFKGSERGELASSQDESAHDGRCESRREKVITPRVIAPLVNRLIALRALPEPDSGGWTADWPSLREKTPMERAELVAKVVELLQKYIAGGVTEIISPEDLLGRKEFLGLPADVVKEVLEKAAEIAAEAEKEEEKKAMEAQKQAMKAQSGLPAPVPGAAPPPGLPAPGKPPAAKGLPAPPAKTPPATGPNSGKPTAKPPSTPPKASEATKGVTKPPTGKKLLGANVGGLRFVVPDTSSIDAVRFQVNAGSNCGTGSGGFKKGNTCSRGGGGGFQPLEDSSKIAVGDTVKYAYGPAGSPLITGTKVTKLEIDSDGDVFINFADPNKTTGIGGKFVFDHEIKNGGWSIQKASSSDSKPKSKLKDGDDWANSLTESGTLGGSTGAKLVTDADGNKFVKKYGANEGHIKNEFLADEMYRSAGVAVPNSKMYKDADGKPYKLSEFVEGETLGSMSAGSKKDAAIKKIQEDFAIDATLGNWDVVGSGQDNILVDKDGTPWRIDNGGALAYRAQGEPKGSKWNHKNEEVNTMRNAVGNSGAKSVFGSMTDAQVKASFDKHEQVLGLKGPAKIAGKVAEKAVIADRAKNGYELVKGASSKSTTATTSTGSVKDFHNGVHKELGFKKVDQQKFEFLNPNGVQNGEIYLPLSGTSLKDPANKANIDKISAIVPAGTKIKVAYVSGAQVKKGTAVHPVAAGKKTKVSGVASGSKYSGSGFTTSTSKTTFAPTPGTASKAPKVAAGKLKYDVQTIPHEALVASEKLPSKQKQAIKQWTNGGYTAFRDEFTTNGIATTERAKHLDAGLRALPSQAITTYRGIHDSKWTQEQIKLIDFVGEGGTYVNGPPTSTSRHPAKVFADGGGSGNVMFVFKNKTAKSVEGISSHSSELELMTLPATAYKINKIHKDVTVEHSTYSSSKWTRVVELEEI